jgi:hypothetical protein
MDLTEDSETSAKVNLTPGKYRKENIQKCTKYFYGKICEVSLSRKNNVVNMQYINNGSKHDAVGVPPPSKEVEERITCLVTLLHCQP